MTALAHTRAALRRMIPGLPGAFLRNAIQRTAEEAAAEGIGSLAIFARVIDRHGDRLDDEQLAALAGALAEDLPMSLELVTDIGAPPAEAIVGIDVRRDDDGRLALAVRAAFAVDEGGAA